MDVSNLQKNMCWWTWTLTLTFHVGYSGFCCGSRRPHDQIDTMRIMGHTLKYIMRSYIWFVRLWWTLQWQLHSMQCLGRVCGSGSEKGNGPGLGLGPGCARWREDDSSDEWFWTECGTDMMRFRSSAMHRISLLSSVSLERRRPESRIQRTSAVLKKAVTDKHSKWQGKTWRQLKEQCSGAHASQDVWRKVDYLVQEPQKKLQNVKDFLKRLLRLLLRMRG